MFDPLSLNSISLYVLHCFYCLYSYARYYQCVQTRVQPRSLLKHNNSQSTGIYMSCSRALHGKFKLTLSYTIVHQQLVFNSASFIIRLANTHIHPPLGVFSIGIRAYAPDIRFNHVVRSWIANLDLHLHTYSLYSHGSPCPSHV